MDKTIDIKDVDYYPFIKVILKALAGYHKQRINNCPIFIVEQFVDVVFLELDVFHMFAPGRSPINASLAHQAES